MSTSNDTAVIVEPGWDIEIPLGWTAIDPPDGVAFVAIADEPDDTCAFRSNLVVTHQPRPTGSNGEPSVEEVNAYVEALLDALEANLPEAMVLGVWTAGRDGERLATQRALIAYRAPVGDGNGSVDVDMLQQHVWCADEVVTITVTVPADVDQPAIDVLNTCVESLR